MAIIRSADAIIEPDTMMILSSDASLANTAMFASCWLQEVAGSTSAARMEDGIIVRIQMHVLFMVLCCN
jgi:hypothetical protein